MRLLEDQHWTQPNGLGTTATNVDTQIAHLLQQGTGVRSVEGNISTPVLAAKVLDPGWVLGCQHSQTIIETRANLSLFDRFC